MKGNKGKILVVDDYANWRIFLEYVLRSEGHQVVSVSSSSEAEQKLLGESFDVVILDVRLVDEERYNVQGMALLQRAKSLSPSPGAIILTGYHDPAYEEHALRDYGADAYFQKVPNGEQPIVDALKRKVAELVTRSRSL